MILDTDLRKFGYDSFNDLVNEFNNSQNNIFIDINDYYDYFRKAFKLKSKAGEYIAYIKNMNQFIYYILFIIDILKFNCYNKYEFYVKYCCLSYIEINGKRQNIRKTFSIVNVNR